jgi:PhnB protein
MADSELNAPIQVYLTVKGGDAAIDFYKLAFGAEETFCQRAEDGVHILHANLSMFGGQVMLSDELSEPGGDVVSPLTAGSASVTIHVNLPSPDAVDETVQRAFDAGATITMPVADMFWGARYGRIRDPFGHVWSFAAPAETASK